MKIEKSVWSKVLQSRCLPAVKNCEKCTDKEIREFIESRQKILAFEEKVFLIVLWLEGDAPREEEEL